MYVKEERKTISQQTVLEKCTVMLHILRENFNKQNGIFFRSRVITQVYSLGYIVEQTAMMM